jgi:hypothetical protein
VTKGDPPSAAPAGGKRSATPAKVTAKNTASRKRDKHPRLLLSVGPVKGRICLLFRALNEAVVEFRKVVGHADKLGRTSDSHESYNQRCDRLAVAAMTAG